MKVSRRNLHRRGGILFVGVTQLQECFDAMKQGDGLNLEWDEALPVNRIILVTEENLLELMAEFGGNVDPSTLN